MDGDGEWRWRVFVHWNFGFGFLGLLGFCFLDRALMRPHHGIRGLAAHAVAGEQKCFNIRINEKPWLNHENEFSCVFFMFFLFVFHFLSVKPEKEKPTEFGRSLDFDSTDSFFSAHRSQNRSAAFIFCTHVDWLRARTTSCDAECEYEIIWKYFNSNNSYVKLCKKLCKFKLMSFWCLFDANGTCEFRSAFLFFGREAPCLLRTHQASGPGKGTRARRIWDSGNSLISLNSWEDFSTPNVTFILNFTKPSWKLFKTISIMLFICIYSQHLAKKHAFFWSRGRSHLCVCVSVQCTHLGSKNLQK